MRRIGATRNISTAITTGLALAAAVACGTTPVVHELSAGANPLPRTALGADAPTTSAPVVGVVPAAASVPHREQAPSEDITADDTTVGDWEGQRWDLGLIARVHERDRTIAFDREQIADPDGTLQSGPTLTGEPTTVHAGDVRNESAQLRTFALDADPELLRPAATPSCAGSSATTWVPFALADLAGLRRTYPHAVLSFDDNGRISRIRLLPTC